MGAEGKKRPGEPFQTTAKQWNEIIDAAEYVKARNLPGSSRPAAVQPSKDSGIVRVKNDSGSALAQFAIAGVSAPIFNPSDSDKLPEFKRQPAFSVVEPEAEAHRGAFVVTLEPIPDGSVGSAVVAGVVQCLVNVSNEDHRRATVIEGDSAKLESAHSGGAEIITCQAGTGEKWAVVRLGNGTKLEILSGVYASSLAKAGGGSSPGSASSASFTVKKSAGGATANVGDSVTVTNYDVEFERESGKWGQVYRDEYTFPQWWPLNIAGEGEDSDSDSSEGSGSDSGGNSGSDSDSDSGGGDGGQLAAPDGGECPDGYQRISVSLRTPEGCEDCESDSGSDSDSGDDDCNFICVQSGLLGTYSCPVECVSGACCDGESIPSRIYCDIENSDHPNIEDQTLEMNWSESDGWWSGSVDCGATLYLDCGNASGFDFWWDDHVNVHTVIDGITCNPLGVSALGKVFSGLGGDASCDAGSSTADFHFYASPTDAAQC